MPQVATEPEAEGRAGEELFQGAKHGPKVVILGSFFQGETRTVRAFTRFSRRRFDTATHRGLLDCFGGLEDQARAVAEKYAANIFVLRGNEGVDMTHPEAAGGRSAVLFGADGALIVDTEYPPTAEKQLKVVRSFTNAPIKYVINTHVHPDHVGSNAIFAKEGARIIASENLLAEMKPNPAAPPPASPPATDPLDALFDAMFKPMNAQGVYARTGAYESVVEALAAPVLRELRAFVQDHGVQVFSEALAWSADDSPLFVTLPIPSTAAAVQWTVARIHQAQDALGMRIGVREHERPGRQLDRLHRAAMAGV